TPSHRLQFRPRRRYAARNQPVQFREVLITLFTSEACRRGPWLQPSAAALVVPLGRAIHATALLNVRVIIHFQDHAPALVTAQLDTRSAIRGNDSTAALRCPGEGGHRGLRVFCASRARPISTSHSWVSWCCLSITRSASRTMRCSLDRWRR